MYFRPILRWGLLFLFIFGAAQAADARDQLAVMDLKANHGVEKSLALALSVIIRDKIHSFGQYEVLSMQDLEAIAERESVQMKLGCDENQCLLDFGQKLGTKFMMAGSLSKLGGIYVVSLRLLDTQGAAAGVKQRQTRKCRCDEGQLIEAAEKLAAGIMGVVEAPPKATRPKPPPMPKTDVPMTVPAGWRKVVWGPLSTIVPTAWLETERDDQKLTVEIPGGKAMTGVGINFNIGPNSLDQSIQKVRAMASKDTLKDIGRRELGGQVFRVFEGMFPVEGGTELRLGLFLAERDLLPDLRLVITVGGDEANLNKHQSDVLTLINSIRFNPDAFK